MKLVGLTEGIATFEISDREREGLARVLGAEKPADLAVHWIGPRTSDWWKAWNNASAVTQKGDTPKPGAMLTVEPGHLALLRRSNTDWNYCEFGAMEINPKRPYGNSDVIGDIAEILGGEVDDDGEVSPEFAATAYRLHRETEFCVQILLTLGAIEEGATYRNDALSTYSDPVWVKMT